MHFRSFYFTTCNRHCRRPVMSRIRTAFFLIVLLGIIQAATAEITVLRHYRMGESDPNGFDESGAVAGGPAFLAVDETGAADIDVYDPFATYSSDVPGASLSSSQLSLSLSGAALVGVSGLVTDATDNFGIEAWVKPAPVSRSQVIAYNGTSSNGWGLFHDGTYYHAGLTTTTGAVSFGSKPVQFGVWTHLALVRASGVATFYVNGVPVATSNAMPTPPSDQFTIGGLGPNQQFAGNLDEVRVFTFAPKRFSISDLLYPSVQGNGLRISLANGFANLSWTPGDYTMLLQASSSLETGSWVRIPHIYGNGLFQATDEITLPRQFYRLAPCEPTITTPVATVQTGSAAPVTQELDPSSTTNLSVYRATLENDVPLVIDFSQSTALNVCDPEELTYSWEIQYDDVAVTSPYFIDGISGWDTSTLTIPANVLVNTTEGKFVNFTLTVQRPGHSVQLLRVIGNVIGSTLTLPPNCTSQIDSPLLTMKTGNGAANPLLRSPVSTPDFTIYVNVQVRNNQPVIFDVSGSLVNICDPGELTYSWDIMYDDPQIPSPYRVNGITGYDTPKLTIQPNSMLRTSGANRANFWLTIGRLGEFQALVHVAAIVTDSTLTFSQYQACQSDPNCPTPNAVPTP